MDHTEALPLDVLAGVLRRLSPRDLAVSRCVREAWRDIVDRRRLLRLRAEHLPWSVEGIFINYCDYPRPHFLGRPSTDHPGLDYGNLHFLPGYRKHYGEITDHCNGLLLYRGWNDPCVVNPATRRWERLPANNRDDGERCNAYLAFDPTLSPHYEVFMIQYKDLGLFDLTDCKCAEVPPEQLVEENFTLSTTSLSKVWGSAEAPQHSEEWPPPVLTLQVFSSSTERWQERSFVREGSATKRVVNARGKLRVMLSGGLFGPRWRYSVYYHGALYVLHCRGAFVTRLSLSNSTYQVVETPIDAEERKHGQSYLGRLGKDVYYAKIHDRIQIWTLSESSGQLEWAPKCNIGLEPLENITLPNHRGPWVFDDDKFLDCYGNNKILARQDFDWDSDDDDILGSTDECGGRHGYDKFFGFHPYKEVAFFLVERFEAVAYHLDSSKVQYIGYLRPDYDSYTLSANDLFLYTPCMIGDLKESANIIED